MLLPTRIDVQKSKASERKVEIDNGVALARQIDSLRATFAQERVAHEAWKKTSIEALNQDIQGLQEGIGAKKREIALLDEQRRKLLEPLDFEWNRLNENRAQIEEERQELFLDQERFKDKVNNLEEEKIKVGHSLKKAKQNEQRTEKSLEEAEEIREFVQKSLQKTLVHQENQEKYYESRNKDLEKTIQSYEVALKTLEIREQAVKDKELELLERETLLKDRQAMFERNKLR